MFAGKKGAQKSSKQAFSCLPKHDLLAQYEVKKPEQNWLSYTKFALNYICLTSILFALLLVTTNISAYKAIVDDFVNPEKLANIESTMKKTILESSALTADVGSALATLEEERERKKRLEKLLEKHLQRKKVAIKNDVFSVERFNRVNDKVALDFQITPYENRIVIPKIGKNIPLVNVEGHNAGSSSEWHKIFMKELAHGVIKYPGSADPGQVGNSFIFGHSSNFPWAKGPYNEVFALLDKLTVDDEIITYHNQKKYVYKVRTKQVVKPGYVNALEGDKDKKLMTLMTCWPVGTTLNRLLVIAELDEVESSDTLALEDHFTSSL